MEFFVRVGNNSEILTFSTTRDSDDMTEIEYDLGYFYPDRLEGYFMAYSAELEANHLEYSEERYQEAYEARLEEEQQARESAILNAKMKQFYLDNIPLSEALNISSQYPEWQPNTAYTIGNRFKYNNILYSAIDDIISVEGEPPGISSYYNELINLNDPYGEGTE